MRTRRASALTQKIDDPHVPQNRSAKSLLVSLEKLMYQKFKWFEELDEIAGAIDSEIDRMKDDPPYRP